MGESWQFVPSVELAGVVDDAWAFVTSKASAAEAAVVERVGALQNKARTGERAASDAVDAAERTARALKLAAGVGAAALVLGGVWWVSSRGTRRGNPGKLHDRAVEEIAAKVGATDAGKKGLISQVLTDQASATRSGWDNGKRTVRELREARGWRGKAGAAGRGMARSAGGVVELGKAQVKLLPRIGAAFGLW